MAKVDLVVIGAGLSGLAAGIRQARFGGSVLILEQHTVPGGLNSYYTRRGFLFETGLHAITNYPAAGDRSAPFNRLLRQLKFKAGDFVCREQFISEINFGPGDILTFTNDFEHFANQVRARFPGQADGFAALCRHIDAYDPFDPRPYVSARRQVTDFLTDPLLVDMLFCPVMYYGSSQEDDMDMAQFVIMFRALFKEGFFRLAGGIKGLLDTLTAHYASFGGEIRYNARVGRINLCDRRAVGVELENGEVVEAVNVISTVGYPGTLELLGLSTAEEISRTVGRLSFVENIYLLKHEMRSCVRNDRTIIFFNRGERFRYHKPDAAVSLESGVICFPGNFAGEDDDYFQVRTTHMANYDCWRAYGKDEYAERKEYWQEQSHAVVSGLIGTYNRDVLYKDGFTPLTIERYTGKRHGAIYGSPIKTKEGLTPAENCYIAGTDQGFLGIVGAMLSGISIVNQHTLGGDQARGRSVKTA